MASIHSLGCSVAWCEGQIVIQVPFWKRLLLAIHLVVVLPVVRGQIVIVPSWSLGGPSRFGLPVRGAFVEFCAFALLYQPCPGDNIDRFGKRMLEELYRRPVPYSLGHVSNAHVSRVC